MPSRRILLGLIAFLAGSSHAQHGPTTIGLLIPAKESSAREFYDSLVREMLARGYSKSRLNIVMRATEGEDSRLNALAEDLAKLKVDLIVAAGTDAVVAARRANPAIPIVFFSLSDPVAQGLAESLARPGRNMTGLTNFSAGELVAKRFDLLRQLMPALARVSYLVNPATAPEDIERLARDMSDKFGVRGLVVRATSLQEVEGAFQAMVAFHAQAVYVAHDYTLAVMRSEIADLSLRNRVASIWAFELAVEAGGLMSYGAYDENLGGTVASYVAKILQGERAGDLPIQEPSKFRLVINRKTAGALGLTIPRTLLLQADRVID